MLLGNAAEARLAVRRPVFFFPHAASRECCPFFPTLYFIIPRPTLIFFFFITLMLLSVKHSLSVCSCTPTIAFVIHSYYYITRFRPTSTFFNYSSVFSSPVHCFILFPFVWFHLYPKFFFYVDHLVAFLPKFELHIFFSFFLFFSQGSEKTQSSREDKR